METHRRSIVKSLTWRLIAFLTTIVVVYVYSGDLRESLVVGIAANSIKIFLYYLHERAWTKIDYGMVNTPDYQI